MRPANLLVRTGRRLLVEGHLAEALAYTLAFSAFTVSVYLVVALPLLP